MSDKRYEISFTSAAARQLRKLDPDVQGKLAPAIDGLREQPRPAGVKALKGRPGQLRLRVGSYRVVYTVEDDQLLVLVITVGHRREAYR